jgi:sensor histidine kinase YesM
MKRWLLLLCFGIALWTASWILIDWVLNFAIYHGMEAPLWLFQVPFSSQVIYVSGWHAYQLAFYQCCIALVLLVYTLVKLISREH